MKGEQSAEYVRGHALRLRSVHWPSGTVAATWICDCGKRYGSTMQIGRQEARLRHRAHKAELIDGSDGS